MTGISTDQIVVPSGMSNMVIGQVQAGDSLSAALSKINHDWWYFMRSGTCNPTPVSVTANGVAGNAYTLTFPVGAPYATLYRFVPSTYTNTGDSFYTTLMDSVLTGFVCSRATL